MQVKNLLYKQSKLFYYKTRFESQGIYPKIHNNVFVRQFCYAIILSKYCVPKLRHPGNGKTNVKSNTDKFNDKLCSHCAKLYKIK